MDILNEIKTFLNKYKLLNKGTHFLIGFSGGADSMLLLYCLNELQKTYKFRFSALHINHNWRGEESDNEEENCKNFCKKYSVDFYSERLDKNIKHDENSARIARYILFNEYAKKLNSTAILTAHNSTDVIETFIYRLIKGTGTFGAASIPEVREGAFCKIYRPLINVSSKEVREKCKELKLDYNIDSSNFNDKYKRNFIRNKILPKFEEINTNYETAILNFIENIKSGSQVMEEFYNQNCEKVIAENKLKTQLFMEFSDDIKRVIIYKYLKNNGFEPEKKLILNLIKQIEKNFDKPNGKKYSVKNPENKNINVLFFCSKEECYLVNKKFQKDLNIKFEKEFSSPIKKEKYTGQKPPKSEDYSAIVSVDALKFPLVLRTRKNGDIIQPFSHKSTIKLKDYFIEKKIPEHMRDDIPLLCDGKEILWAVGVGLSEKLRAELNSKEKCTIIKYIKKD